MPADLAKRVEGRRFDVGVHVCQPGKRPLTYRDTCREAGWYVPHVIAILRIAVGGRRMHSPPLSAWSVPPSAGG